MGGFADRDGAMGTPENGVNDAMSLGSHTNFNMMLGSIMCPNPL